MRQVPVITIDGPSGSGKGTISRLLAHDLGWHFLDSGALYRLVALGASKHRIALHNGDALAQYARELAVAFTHSDSGEEPDILLEGQVVTREIRTETCGNQASQVAAIPAVRQALLARQRDFAQAPGLVADGRDMGTAIFPQADVKIFLTASATERAQRRYNQLKQKGFDGSLAALVREITERDARDSQRQTSPLKPATDAVVIDTSAMNITEVLAKIKSICRQRLADVLEQ
jgi:CMP/dCMP kinase